MSFTYPDIGATRAAIQAATEAAIEGASQDARLSGAALPAGYDHVTRHARIGAGEAAFRAAADALARWEPQLGAGLKVRTDATRPEVGARFASGLGVGPVRFWAPCEVVWVIDEQTRYGFGFGTLQGHPESGEEGLLVSVDDDGAVWFDVRAFSRPGRWWVKPGHALARRLQSRITDRYVRSMIHLSS